MTRPTMIAVTGSSKPLGRDMKWIVYNAVEQVVQRSKVHQWLTGAAPNVDVYAAECAIRLDADAQHHIYIPTWAPVYNAPPIPCKHDREAIKRLARLAAELGVYMKWHWAAAGVGSEGTGLLRRNDILAVNCTHLLAFPEAPAEEQRSGTWATVRRARKLDRPIKVHPLDGSDPVVERPRRLPVSA